MHFLYYAEDNVIPKATTEANTKLSSTINSIEEMLLDVRDIVPKASIYAQNLDEKSMELESLLTNTRNLTGVRAASVYQNIANNINEAREFAQDASKSADNATNLVKFPFSYRY
jgi:ABC-type transporter Mla subunit MlaD